jgi:hypothetical protein
LELVVPGGVERRAARRPWDVRAREDSHARRVAEDSNSVWEQPSPEELDALSGLVLLTPPGKPLDARMQQAVPQPAS